MIRRNFLKAIPILAAPAALIPEIANAEPINIAMLNCFKTTKEAEAHRMKIKDPELYGILTMWGGKDEALHTVVEKRILRMFV